MHLELDDFERALLFKHLELVKPLGVAYRLAEECMRLSLAINQYIGGRGEVGDITQAIAGVQVRIAACSNIVGQESLRHWTDLKLREIQDDIESRTAKIDEHGNKAHE